MTFTNGIGILSAGQSNEVSRATLEAGAVPANPRIRAFLPMYALVQASEPLYNTGALDSGATGDTAAGHGSLLALATGLLNATGRDVLLIPAAKGATTTTNWLPDGANPYNRATLFGSTLTRAALVQAMGQRINLLTWYQGEQNSAAQATIDSFVADTKAIWAAFRQHLGYMPIIFNQLGMHNSSSAVQPYFSLREFQRQMEEGSGNAANAQNLAYMVVSHDLPMKAEGTIVHLNQAAQIENGLRRELLFREKVLRETGVDGTGPRLVSVTKPTTTTVRVKTTQVINADASYEGYFSLLDGATPVTPSSIGRDPADATAVLLTLPGVPAGTLTVNYHPPITRAAGTWAVNCVRAASKSDSRLTYALPLPAFTATV